MTISNCPFINSVLSNFYSEIKCFLTENENEKSVYEKHLNWNSLINLNCIWFIRPRFAFATWFILMSVQQCNTFCCCCRFYILLFCHWQAFNTINRKQLLQYIFCCFFLCFVTYSGKQEENMFSNLSFITASR